MCCRVVFCGECFVLIKEVKVLSLKGGGLPIFESLEDDLAFS